MVLPAWMPRLDAGKFRRNLVLKRATTLCRDKLWPVLDGVGQERLCWLIEHDKSLVDRMPADWRQAIAQQAGNYKWAADALTDQDLVTMLPPWLVKTCIGYEAKGEAWLQRELSTLRSFFG